MDEVFKALADPNRRELLDRLMATDGLTVSQLCAGLPMTRQAVSQHLAQLEAANLIVTAWRGREKVHHLNPVPIGEIYDRWIGRYERQRVTALVNLKQSLESRSMIDQTFAYSIFIDSTPERIWQALTDGEFSKQYWAGREITSDWRIGSPVAFKVEMTASCGPRSAGLSLAFTLATIFLSPAMSVRPLARIASRWAPRATTETSLPASANRAAKFPPIAPAPKTQMRMKQSPVALS